MTTDRIIYEAAVRAVDRQERALDELRARAALLLGAASFVVSFLGKRALSGREPVGTSGKIGIVAYVGVAGIMLAAVAPVWGWRFGFEPFRMLKAQENMTGPRFLVQLL